MLVEKVIIISVEILFVILLSIRYIKKYAPENLVIVPLVCFFTASYISFTINNAYIPIYFQICIFVFCFVIPVFAILLQYNNIIIARKILYYIMKYSFISKEYQKTIKHILKLIELNGNNNEYMYMLGICYKNLDDIINAREVFKQAIEMNKEDYKSCYELGKILDELNNKEEAVQMFNKAIRINGDFYEAREALGICLTRQGKFKEAVRVYKRGIEKFPQAYVMHYNLAMLDMELEMYEEAREEFKKSGELKPNLYTAFYNLGNIYYFEELYDKAIEAYKKMLSSLVYAPKAYYKIAVVYATKKEYEKAMAALEYAIELDPKYEKEAKEEFVFRGMYRVINKYLVDKEILKNKENQRNYIVENFRLFKRKDNVFDEIDISKYNKEKKVKEEKHA